VSVGIISHKSSALRRKQLTKRSKLLSRDDEWGC
jgi:hypothetical protein